jgi:polyribonucleotide 5'-hydroxyl-kinase
VDVELGFDAAAPLVMYYGHHMPADHMDLYDRCVQTLAERLSSSVLLVQSVWIIRLPSMLDPPAYAKLAETMQADALVVVGDDKMHALLRKTMDGKKVDVRRHRTPGGALRLDGVERETLRGTRLREYFYGRAPVCTLHPVSLTLSFDDVKVYALGGGPRAPEGCLPIGGASVSDPLRVRAITLGLDLERAVLGVVHAKSEADLGRVPAAGLVCVQRVDVEKRQLTVLAPNAAPLPSHVFMHGNMFWHE